MAFPVLACTDIFGEKVNVEFPFNNPPASIEELHRTLEHVFRGEEKAIKLVETGMAVLDAAAVRPSEPFTVSRVQRYEDDTHAWVELRDTLQLRAYDQLYVFRKNATKADISPHRELPPPRKSLYFDAECAVGAARRGAERERGAPSATRRFSSSPVSQPHVLRQPHSSSEAQDADKERANGPLGNVAPLSVMPHACNGSAISHTMRPAREQVDVVFGIGDATHKGYLTVREFQYIFQECQIQFPPEVVEELYRSFAREKHGERSMSLQAFHEYAREFTQAITIAYLRLSNRDRQKALEQEWRDACDAVDEFQRQKKALEERLNAIQKQLGREQERMVCIQKEADELKKVANSDCLEREQRLLDKEVSVFKYRRRLQQEEMDYERLATEQQQWRRLRTPCLTLGFPQMQAVSDRYGPSD